MSEKIHLASLCHLLASAAHAYLRKLEGPIPWEALIASEGSLAEVLGKVGANVASFGDDDVRADGDETAMLLIDRALADGRTDAFALTDGFNHGVLFAQPISAFIQFGYHRTLARFIEEGFDPLEPRGTMHLTALQIAEMIGREETVGFLRSCVKRRQAQSILNSLPELAAGKP